MHHSQHPEDSHHTCCSSKQESECCRSQAKAAGDNHQSAKQNPFTKNQDSKCGCSHDDEASSSCEEPSEESCCSARQETVQQADDFKDKYLRLLAENENMRRRFQRESQESIRYAAQKIIVDLLDPLDNFEKALFHAGYSPSEEVRNWVVGFKMIHQQFKDWLSAQGVHSFVSKDQPFSAQLHEAIETVNTNQVREGTIVEEYVKGYKMHDRVLRPAKVSIAKPLESSTQAVSDAEEELNLDDFPQLNS